MPWTKSGSFADLMLLMDKMFGWIYVIIAFLGAFVIANVMMMVVLERKKEIGLLKSMGMPKREILYLFLVEGSLLGAIGSAAGILIGLGLCLLFSKVGIGPLERDGEHFVADGQHRLRDGQPARRAPALRAGRRRRRGDFLPPVEEGRHHGPHRSHTLGVARETRRTA